MLAVTNTWVTWNGSSVAHAADRAVHPGDVSNGDFPLACGRWAPSGWDKTLSVSHGRRCRGCEKALAS